MNIAIKILSSVLVAIVLSVNANCQTTDRTNGTHPAKNDTTKRSLTTGENTASQSVPPKRTSTPPEPPEKEEKKWGLQVVTGEKWYQVSIKLVM